MAFVAAAVLVSLWSGTALVESIGFALAGGAAFGIVSYIVYHALGSRRGAPPHDR